MVLKDRINNSNWHFIKTLTFRLHFPVIIFKEYTNKVEIDTENLRISILEIPYVPIFRENGQLKLFGPNLPQNGFFWLEIK